MLYIILQPPISTLFPYTTLFRSERGHGRSYANAVRVSKRQDRRPRREGEHAADESVPRAGIRRRNVRARVPEDRKSTRLNSSHQIISYAVFCLKKKNKKSKFKIY